MKKKVLLMGKKGSGKTSMRTIYFEGYSPRKTSQLRPTVNIEQSCTNFLGIFTLNLWDCGGQKAFMEKTIGSKREDVFRDVAVLVYVFDALSSEEEMTMELKDYKTCLNALSEYSPSAKIFCLLNKLDALYDKNRDLIITIRENEIESVSRPAKSTIFMTNIFDETLLKAWSSIIQELLPYVEDVKRRLKHFGDFIKCEEVLLFERNSSLIIASYERANYFDKYRLERVSDVIKRFRWRVEDVTRFKSMESRYRNVSVFIEQLTPNTFMMIVMSDPNIPTASVTVHMKDARKNFVNIERLKREYYFK